MRRAGALVLAVTMVVQMMLLGPALAQPGAPGDPTEQTPEAPDIDDLPDEVPERVPEDPETPAPISPSTMVVGRYFEEDYEASDSLSQWAKRQLVGDRQDEPLWKLAPLGRSGSSAATLGVLDSAGWMLPPDVHQAVESRSVDLTPVPSLDTDEEQVQGTERARERTEQTAQRLVDDVVTVEPEREPRAAARLVVDHRYSFPEDRFGNGEAKTGFTIEARSPDGEWVPLEPAPGWKTARRTAGSQAADLSHCESTRPDAGPADGTVDPPDLPLREACIPGPLEAIESTETESASEIAGVASPAFSNARVAPLNARGFVGDSDSDNDGEPDVVRHTFDLSPWAGKEVQVRFRAGTSLMERPGAFWAIDEARVEAGSHVANLRLELVSPAQDHLAPPGEPFPVRAQVQNVGQAVQSGPFDISVTVQGPSGTTNETLRLQGPLEFLETTEGTINVTPALLDTYTVRAEIDSQHPDADPRDDETGAALPVGEDRQARIQILRESPVLEAGEVVNGTVVVENEGNVALEGELTLRAHPYDAFSSRPVGEGIDVLPQPVAVELPPDPDRHPSGVDARKGVPFDAVLPEGSYVLVARLGDSVGTAPVGVGTSAPPVAVDEFETMGPGATSFELTSSTGSWDARAMSDVSSHLVPSGRELSQVLDQLSPGTPGDRGSWVPTAHHGVVLDPADQGRMAGLAASGEVLPSEDVFDRDYNPFVESPREPVSVSVLSREVDLRDVESAELSFLSSLSVPPDEVGLTQLRVHVQERERVPDELRPFVNLLDPWTPTNEDACQIAARADGSLDCRNAEQRGEPELCHQRTDRGENVEAVTSLCARMGSGLTDPCRLGVVGKSQQSADGAQVQETTTVQSCTASVPRWDALAPILDGELVYQDVWPHAWEEVTLDLSEYRGSVVEVAFAFVSESEDAGVYGEDYKGDEIRAERETPDRLRGVLQLDQLQVATDRGLRLSPSDTSPASPIERSATSVGDSEPEEGWRSLGWAYLTGLGDDGTTLHTPAQVRIGDARPPAHGADTSRGINLGTSVDGEEGIRFHATDVTGCKEGGCNPHAQPAVTILRSPEIDLTGLDEPVLEFNHRFDLATDLGAQPVHDQPCPSSDGASPDQACELRRPSNGDLVAELPAPPGAGDACGLPAFDKDGSPNTDNPLRFDHLRCLLDLSREEERFDVQTEVLQDDVRQPPVAAGMFLRVSARTEDGWTEPVHVTPTEGYRFPVDDPHGFAPRLDYRVNWTEEGSSRAFVLGQGDDHSGEGFTLVEPSFTDLTAWAGDSDVDGDREADWVPATVDLSRWAGTMVRVEYVLVSRSLSSAWTGTDVSEVGARPWAIDGLVVREQEDVGRVSLEELGWPSTELPLAQPGEPMPVRLTASTPTGLDGPVNAKAILQDASGCVRETVEMTTRYRDATGSVAPMPEGESLELTGQIPADAVDGPPPWRLTAAVDAGRTPAVPISSQIDAAPTGQVPRDALTGVANPTEDNQLRATVRSPSCSPSPTGWFVRTSGAGLQVNLGRELPHRDGEFLIDATRTRGVDVKAPEGDSMRLSSLPVGAGYLAIGDGEGERAGLEVVPLLQGEDSTTVSIEPAREQVPPGSTLEVRAMAGQTLTDARLHVIPLETGRAQEIGLGELPAADAQTLTVETEELGPHLVAVTGRTPDGGPLALGADGFVVADRAPAQDPILPGRVADLELAQGRIQDLEIESFTVDPQTGISTEERELRATIRNPGNVLLEDVTATLTAGGQAIGTESLGDLLPGQRREVARVYTPSSGSTVVELEATSKGGLDAARRVAVDAREKLATLRPSPQADAEGWSIEGTKASFENASGKAPRDVTGTLPLEGISLEQLADFQIMLDHDLDMEHRFDGGQVIIHEGNRTRVLDEGPAFEAMSPFSPIQGNALTGEISGRTPAAPGTAQQFRFDESLSVLVNETGEDLLEDLEDRIESAGETDRLRCEGGTHLGEEVGFAEESTWCEWGRSLVPVPESAFSNDVWYFHVGPYLSGARDWQADVSQSDGEGSQSHTVEVKSVTQHLYLEAGEDLVQAAQTEGSLEVLFPEARLLGNRFAGSEATLQICARFVEYDQQALPHDVERDVLRCSNLDHDTDPLRQRDWGETALRIPGVPDGEFDIVRLEFEFRSERTSGMEADDEVSGPFQGWYVGPVTAEAGGLSVDWEPSKTGMRADPTTGLSPADTQWPVQQEQEIGRHRPVVDQSGLVTVQAIVDGEEVDTMEDPGLPRAKVPLASCQWTRKPSTCTWFQALEDTAYPHRHDYGSQGAALSTVAARLGLSCGLPPSQGSFQVSFQAPIGSDDPFDPATDCTPGNGLGLGVQVLDRARDPTHPVPERTRLLTMAVQDDGGVTFMPREPSGKVGGSGYNLDYRVAFPIDLTEATGRAVANLTLDITAATVGLVVRPEGSDTWQTTPMCRFGAAQCTQNLASGHPTLRVNLTEFTGQRIEMGIHATHDGDDGKVIVESLRVEGGLLHEADGRLALRAWTDPSVEGRGWSVDEVSIFGQRYEANVGVDRHESRLIVQDRLHVLPELETTEDDTLAWSSPLRLRLYNQGSEKRTVELEGSLPEARSDCEVLFEPEDIRLDPRTTTWWEGTVSFEDGDAQDDHACFPELPTRGRGEHLPSLDVWANGTGDDFEDEEATLDDNVRAVPLAVDPHGETTDEELPERLEPHAEGIRSELEVSPSRPREGQLVTIEATLRAVAPQQTTFGADLHLYDAGQLHEPGTDPEDIDPVAAFVGDDATPPPEPLEPYEKQTLTWTYRVSDDWQNATILRLETQRTDRSGTEGPVSHAWFQVPDTQAESFSTVQVSQDACSPQAAPYRVGCTSATKSFVDWSSPLVAIQGSWNFPTPDERGHALTGWVLQACLGSNCDEEEDPQTPRANYTDWTTLPVVHAPGGAVAELDPASCPVAILDTPEDDERSTSGAWSTDTGSKDCEGNPRTTARETWANVAAGKVRGTPAVIAGRAGAADAPEMVLFSLTDCKACPDWTSPDRHADYRFRVVSFSSEGVQDPTEQPTPPIESLRGMVTPVALGLEAPPIPSMETIPEAERKEVPLTVQPHGDIGTHTAPRVQVPDGWEAKLEGFPENSVLEEETSGRLLVASPISPTGRSMGASIGATFDILDIPENELVDASPSVSVPIQTDPGGHPNLVVERLRVPADIEVGEDVTVEALVRNTGQATSTEVPLTGVARFEDGTVELVSPTEEFQTLAPLPPGGSTLALLKWNPEAQGEAMLRVGADLEEIGPLAGPVVVPWGSGELRELRECTVERCPNVGERSVDVLPPPVADLSVHLSVDAEGPLVQGEPVDVRITIENGGPATVPRFEARLLAGVVSLLPEDPLVPSQELAPGEAWSQTVTLIPPRAGQLRLTASAFADERLVEEDRSLRPDGSIADEDNVRSRRIPVVSHEIALDLPAAVDGHSAIETGNVSVPVTVRNHGSEHERVSLAALGPGIIGTLRGAQGEPSPVLELGPGESREGTLALVLEQAPPAGRLLVDVEASSASGSTREQLEIEVPRRVEVEAGAAQVTIEDPLATVSVPVMNTGNAPVEAEVGVQAPGLRAHPEPVSLDAGEEQMVEVNVEVVAEPADGSAWVRAASNRSRAPLFVDVDAGPLPTIREARPVAGNQSHLNLVLANAGSEPTFQAQLEISRDNATIHQQEVSLDAGEESRLEVPFDGKPGRLTLALVDEDTSFTRQLEGPDLRPQVRVDGLLLRPPVPEAGEDVEVRATLVNGGAADARVGPALLLDGRVEIVLEEPVLVEAGGTETVTFHWRAESGEHTIAVSADPFQPGLTASQSAVLGRSVDVASGGGFWTASGEDSGMSRVPAPTSTAWTAIVLALAGLLARVQRRRRT